MRVLIGCEESGVVRRAFRERGHDAWSCDLVDSRDLTAYHLICDVKDAIRRYPWDLIILHPDCTAMAVSGNRWYGNNMPHNQKRLDSIAWTVDLWELAKKHCPRVVLENPVSVIFSHLNAPVCYVQPWEHGHGETKRTGFALHNVPRIEPTDPVEGREQRVWKMAPGPNRKRDRSKTFPGIAQAMVKFWGDPANPSTIDQLALI